MSQPQLIQFELNRSKERLQYFQQVKQKQQALSSSNHSSVDKWIEIYSERVQNLEKQTKKFESKTLQ